MRLSIKQTLFFLPLLLLTGCGDNSGSNSAGMSAGGSADNGQVSAPPPGGYQAPAPTSVQMAPAPGADNDPLLSEGSGSPDPLISTGQRFPDPLDRGDALQGRTMPTDHSHWLRGSVRDANLTVLFNGVRQGVYTGLVDKDVTMRLRRGINSVTFVYEPHQDDSAAQMSVLESEHHPPIPPLVTFQGQPAASASPLKPTTQTFTFFAK